jgi:hypothetical protein
MPEGSSLNEDEALVRAEDAIELAESVVLSPQTVFLQQFDAPSCRVGNNTPVVVRRTQVQGDGVAARPQPLRVAARRLCALDALSLEAGRSQPTHDRDILVCNPPSGTACE